MKISVTIQSETSHYNLGQSINYPFLWKQKMKCMITIYNNMLKIENTVRIKIEKITLRKTYSLKLSNCYQSINFLRNSNFYTKFYENLLLVRYKSSFRISLQGYNFL